MILIKIIHALKRNIQNPLLFSRKTAKNPELLAKKETSQYQEITRKKPIIERIFAGAKRYHGLAKTR